MSLGVLVDENGESKIRNNNIKLLVDEFCKGNPRGLLDISNWDVSKVTDMHDLFKGELNHYIRCTDVSTCNFYI